MRTFPAIPQSVHAARRFATDTLSSSPASTVEAVELMVSELATNCIRHERTSFHITILGSPQEIRIEVTDSGSGRPTMRSPGPDEPSGRGLQIVDMLSDTWGVEPENPSGKTVWFTMPVAAAMEVASEEVGTRRRIREDAPAFAGDPSTVQGAERTPNGPTSQHRRGTRQYRVPCGPRGAGLRGQGRLSGRRYCQHDESGCHARPAEHLGHLR
ncbi:MAG TPA: ATP-binding protein [Solirubrobacteraceae bacterium]|jgi:anti-sigma regulatory factor (Ser/Thr protein kinase)|nr:ATP-binding protein [Solirubrobacteraceae bacterium]